MWATGMSPKKVEASVTAGRYSEQLIDPKTTAGVSASGRSVEGSARMFNARGEINAQDKKEALDQQMRFAELMGKYRRANNESYFSPEDKQRIIEHALQGDPALRTKFGAEMIPLILDRLDYEGFIRQVFKTHELQQGQINSYEKDVNVTALVIQQDGQTVEHVVRGDRVFPWEFLITAMPQVSITEIAQRQYDVVDRAHDKTTFQIMLKEDRNGLKELYQAAQLENDLINATSSVNKTVLETLQYGVERHRLLVDKFLMNRRELGDLKKNINSLDYDPITARDMLLTGIFGSIWGINLFITAGVDEQGIESVSVPEGMIFGVTAPRYIGAMPIRINLTVLPADQFVHGQAKYGWLFLEQISQVVVNPRAIAVATKPNTTVPAWMTE